MALEINLEKITKDNLHRILPELIRLENNWVGIGDAPWAPENFERELPKKWEMSRYASVFGTIVGYNIASIDGNVGRLNKIVVASDFRNKGIGDMLWKEFLEDCRRNKVERAEFKVLPDNESAISFYKKRGCLFYGDAIGTDKKIRHTVMYPFRLKERVPHSKPTISSDDKEAVIRAIEHGDLATGRMVNYFIDAFTEYIGKEFGVATNSGSAALHLALRALDVKSGDEVILPSYVCNAVLNAVSYCNANPVLVDINPDDYNISLEDAVAKKSDKTKAIILPHMFGKPIKNLDDFLKSFEGTPIIEDCALSVGASYNGKKVGSFGRLSIFSLRATKMLAAGLGGVVLTDDKDLKKRLDDLATYDNRVLGGESYNYQMCDFNAALAMSQLRRLDSFVNARRNVAKKYTEMFQNSKVDFEFPEFDEDNIFFRYIIRHPNSEEFMENVKSRGVDVARPVFLPLHKYLNLPDDNFPNTTKAYQTAVSIPIYPLMDPLIDNRTVFNVAGILVNWRYEK